MDVADWTRLLVAVSGLVTSFTALVVAIKSLQKTKEVAAAVDGKMTELLEVTKQAAVLETKAALHERPKNERHDDPKDATSERHGK